MSIAAAALALAQPFEFDGETLSLSPLTYADLARFSLWMEERARLAALRAVEAGGEGRTIYAAFLAQAAACAYEPGSDTFDLATRTQPGSRKLLALMLGENGAEPTSWRVYADPAAFEKATVLMNRINADPKAQALRRMPTPPKPAAKGPTRPPPTDGGADPPADPNP